MDDRFLSQLNTHSVVWRCALIPSKAAAADQLFPLPIQDTEAACPVWEAAGGEWVRTAVGGGGAAAAATESEWAH